jgi:hypothetical protein
VTNAGTGNAATTGLPWLPKTTLKLKIVATSVDSLSAHKSVADEFSVVMSATCAANKIALDGTTYAHANLGAAISSFIYVNGDSQSDKTPLFSTVKTFVFEPSTYTWLDQTTPSGIFADWISAFDAATGHLTVDAASSSTTFGTFHLRISISDPLALNPAAI